MRARIGVRKMRAWDYALIQWCSLLMAAVLLWLSLWGTAYFLPQP